MSQRSSPNPNICYVVEIEYQTSFPETTGSYKTHHGTYATEQEALEAADTLVELLNSLIARGVLELVEDRRASEGWLSAHWKTSNGYGAILLVRRCFYNRDSSG